MSRVRDRVSSHLVAIRLGRFYLGCPCLSHRNWLFFTPSRGLLEGFQICQIRLQASEVDLAHVVSCRLSLTDNSNKLDRASVIRFSLACRPARDRLLPRRAHIIIVQVHAHSVIELG